MTTATAAKPSWLTYGAILLATIAVAYLGAQISTGSDDAWYSSLNKTPLTPPDWMFALVWPLLYILMAAGAFMVRRAAGSYEAASGALGEFGATIDEEEG